MTPPGDLTDAEASDFDPPLSWDPDDAQWAPTPGDYEFRPRHGRTCSSDPEVGCECGLADWQNDHPAVCLDCGAALSDPHGICPCHDPEVLA